MKQGLKAFGAVLAVVALTACAMDRLPQPVPQPDTYERDRVDADMRQSMDIRSENRVSPAAGGDLG